MKQQTEIKRNCSIDIFRLIFAITVVALHTEIFNSLPDAPAYYLTGILLRLAVPFFFAVAGYYYLQKLINGASCKICLGYLKKIIIQYSLWSFIYFVVFFITSRGYNDVGNYLLSCLKKFFIFGSNPHLWFYLGLIFSVIFCTFIVKFFNGWLLISISVILFILACLGSGYYFVGVQIPGLKSVLEFEHFETVRRIFFMSVPFFTLGLVVYKIESKNLVKLNNLALILTLSSFLGLLVLELFLIKKFNLCLNNIVIISQYPFIMTLLLLLLKNPMSKLVRTGYYCRAMSNFVYYSHPLFLGLALSVASFSPVALFFILSVACCLVAFVIRKINWKYTNIFIK